jgi:hypothetical protein
MSLLPTLHIHLDEAGTLDFSVRSERFYIFTAVWTYDPAPVARALQDLRVKLLKQGHDLAEFHATNDQPRNRMAVYSVIKNHTDWHFASVVVEKNKVFPPLYPVNRFYPRFASMPIRFILRGRMRADTSHVLIYTDEMPVRRGRRALEKAVKRECATDLQGGPSWHIYHHPSHSNVWIQVADYACWAVQRKWEQADHRYLAEIQPRLAAPELDVLKGGEQTFY